MAVDLENIFTSAVAERMARLQEHAIGATQRQTDGAGFDQRALGAVIANELVVSNDPMTMAGMNAAVRIPTTLTHPG